MTTDNHTDILKNPYLIVCAREGNMDGVRDNISTSSQHCRDLALKMAAQQGSSAIVNYLLEHGANARYSNSMALNNAASQGHLNIIKILLPLADMLGNNGHALASAAFRGQVECLNFLLLSVDAKINNSQALIEAVRGVYVFENLNNQQCFDILLPLSDAKKALGYFEVHNYRVWLKYQQLWQEALAQQEAEVLTTALNTVVGPSVCQSQKKM